MPIFILAERSLDRYYHVDVSIEVMVRNGWLVGDLVDLQTLLESIVSTLRLEIQDQILIGENCKTVYHVRQNGCGRILKIGFEPRARQEVEANWIGYANLRRIGAGDLLPSFLEYHEVCGVPCILMEDCGSNFMETVKASPLPTECYARLLRFMVPIYRSSLSSESPVAAMRAMRDLLVKQWTSYLGDLVPEHLSYRLLGDHFEGFGGMRSCFSTFEFKPNDVFLLEQGVKKVDPIRDNLGCPAVDLACFAGVSRDAYHLPGANIGYRLFHQFAVEQLPQILHGSPARLEAAFSLGRSLQCALSARFRRAALPEQGVAFAARSAFYARRCMRLLV